MIRSIAFYTLPDNYRGSEHMAEKRMLTKKVTDDDSFVSLSSAAQALYLHLTMSADDDGFNNQVSLSMFKSHATEEDLKALLEKKFIYRFDNGVIVIKHWKMANAIRKDRYNQTAYKELLSLLQVKENGSYTMISSECQPNGNHLATKWQPSGNQMATNCQPSDNQWLPQVRLDKVSIDNIDVSKIHLSDLQNHVPYDSILNLYHSECKSFPKVRVLSNKRKKAISARWKFYKQDLETFKKVFQLAEESSFLKGQNRKNWSADFDWMMCDANMAKILEGKYKDRQEKNGMIHNKPSDFDFSEIERMSMSDVEE